VYDVLFYLNVLIIFLFFETKNPCKLRFENVSAKTINAQM